MKYCDPGAVRLKVVDVPKLPQLMPPPPHVGRVGVERARSACRSPERNEIVLAVVINRPRSRTVGWIRPFGGIRQRIDINRQRSRARRVRKRGHGAGSGVGSRSIIFCVKLITDGLEVIHLYGVDGARAIVGDELPGEPQQRHVKSSGRRGRRGEGDNLDVVAGDLVGGERMGRRTRNAALLNLKVRECRRPRAGTGNAQRGDESRREQGFGHGHFLHLDLLALEVNAKDLVTFL